MATATPKRVQRLEARLTAEQKRILERAAALKGTSLTGFVVSAAEEAARRVIEREDIVRLSRRDSEMFFDLLMKPPKPNQALKAAARSHRKLVKQDEEFAVANVAFRPGT